MSSHRHFSQGQHYAPSDNRRFVTRGGRSPPRFRGEPASLHQSAGIGRGNEYASRQEAPRERPPPIGRGIPRGPRATLDGPRGRGNFTFPPPRGRGFAPRVEPHALSRDRDPIRDSRPVEPWGDRERNWRDDEADRRSSDIRPGDRERTDGSAYRDSGGRDLDSPRFRGSLRDENLPPFAGSHHEGQTGRARSRGRAEWNPRGRGRGPFREDRELLAGRSRSPPQPLPVEQRYEYDPIRHEAPSNAHQDKPAQSRDADGPAAATEERSQRFDPFTQDRVTAREYPRLSETTTHESHNSQLESRGQPQSHGLGRYPQDDPHDGVPTRRAPGTQLAADNIEPRRSSARSDALHPRDDPYYVKPTPRSSSPPQATEVPAYGSIPTSLPTGTSQPKAPVEPRGSQQSIPTVTASQFSPPTAPKAEVTRQPPTGPKASRASEQYTFGNGERRYSDVRIVREPEKPRVRSPPRYTVKSNPNESASPTKSSFFGSQPSVQPPLQQSALQSLRGPAQSGNSIDVASNVPTGPKADRVAQQVPLRAPVGLSATSIWPRKRPPGAPISPSQPVGRSASILPLKRDSQGIEKSRERTSETEPPPVHYQDKTSPQISMFVEQTPQTKPLDLKEADIRNTDTMALSPVWGDDYDQVSGHSGRAVQKTQTNGNNESIGVSGVEMMELDEQDFEKKELQFLQRKEELEAELIDLSSRHLRAASPLEHLARLGAISLITLPCEDDVPQLSQGEEDSEEKELAVTPESQTPDYAGKYTTELDESNITTSELQALPFLNNDRGTPFEEIEPWCTRSLDYEHTNNSLMKTLELRQRGYDVEEAQIRQQFKDMYEPWMAHVEELDKEPRDEDPDDEEAQEIPVQVPLLDAPPLLLSAGGGRRGGAGVSSEYDIERVLQESVQTANKEDERRRKQEASAKFDPEKEAEIPALLEDDEMSRRALIDSRRLIQEDDPRVQFALEPPIDDFTIEEHIALILNFKDFPKKWGKIAQALVGRSYKDCINHYYASKWQKEFKERRDKRKQKNQRGRLKGPMLGGRARASALISNLGDARTDPYEGDEFAQPEVAVTDSGRPKRAAAPVFGEKEPEDSAQTTPVPARKGGKSTAQQDTTMEKGPKKVRNPNKDKSARKGRPQISRRGSESPEKFAGPIAVTLPHDLTHATISDNFDDQQIHGRRVNPLSVNTDFPGYHVHHQGLTVESEHIGSNYVPAPAAKKPGMSSYWSVEEHKHFKDLISELGSDWQAISQRLGTKTAVMAKNLYKRKLKDGSDPGLEEEVRRADERRNRVDVLASGLTTPGFIKHTADTSSHIGIDKSSQHRSLVANGHASPTREIPRMELNRIQSSSFPEEPLPPSAAKHDADGSSSIDIISRAFLPSVSNAQPFADRNISNVRGPNMGSTQSLTAPSTSPPQRSTAALSDRHMWSTNHNRDLPLQTSNQPSMQVFEAINDRKSQDINTSSKRSTYWQQPYGSMPPSDALPSDTGDQRRRPNSLSDESIPTRNAFSGQTQENSLHAQPLAKHYDAYRGSDQAPQSQSKPAPAAKAINVTQPASQGPRKSNILSILNAEDDEYPSRSRYNKVETPPLKPNDLLRSQPDRYQQHVDVPKIWQNPNLVDTRVQGIPGVVPEPRQGPAPAYQSRRWPDNSSWVEQPPVSSAPSNSGIGIPSLSLSRNPTFDDRHQRPHQTHAPPSQSLSRSLNDWPQHINFHPEQREAQLRMPHWSDGSDGTKSPRFQSSVSSVAELPKHLDLNRGWVREADPQRETRHDIGATQSRMPETLRPHLDADRGREHTDSAPSVQQYSHSHAPTSRLDSFLWRDYRSGPAQRDHQALIERERPEPADMQQRDRNTFRHTDVYQHNHRRAELDDSPTSRLHPRASGSSSNPGFGFGSINMNTEHHQSRK